MKLPTKVSPIGTRICDPFLIQSVKTAMKILFDNFLADWKTDQIRVPMIPLYASVDKVQIKKYH
jgi:hypothetical protein